MKNTIAKIIGVVVLFILFIVMTGSVYIVNEGEVAVVKSLGKVVAAVIDPKDVNLVESQLTSEGVKIILEKGIHFKIPFIQSVEKYSGKYLTYISTQETINTKDNKRIDIQMYAQYRILNPITYKLSLGNKNEANRRIDELVYKTVIQSANALDFSQFFYENTLEDLLGSKQEALNNQLINDFGIYITDIGINRKSVPQANVASIEETMTLQIQKESEKLIAEGDSEYLQAQATSDREKAEIVSTAIEEAAIIKANADAEAIRIYQESLSKDLSFYQFITRMEIYKQIKGTTIFIDQNNDIFDMVNGYTPQP